MTAHTNLMSKDIVEALADRAAAKKAKDNAPMFAANEAETPQPVADAS